MTVRSRIPVLFMLASLTCLALSIIMPKAEAARLSSAASVYLRAHAADAINWQPWDPTSLEQAQRLDKPIFLVVGYAACHWCHVFARTTLQNEQIIETLNRDFVTILVDREERPDLDRHFKTIMSGLAGQTGYPGIFLLTPATEPLFASGYMEAAPKHDDTGLLKILRSFLRVWGDNPAGMIEDARANRDYIRDLAQPAAATPAHGSKDPRDSAVRNWSKAFDPIYGGFGREPKFLWPNVLSFLLTEAARRGDRALSDQILKTLDHMAAGGVRDQLGGAFHRYAVDRAWRVPHFEILLAENALLARLYLAAFQASGREVYADVARGILEDILERLRLPGGGFATSLDAESRDMDGHFYTWTADEIHAALGQRDGDAVIAAFLDLNRNINRGQDQGRGILSLQAKPELLYPTRRRLENALQRLRQVRAERPPPRRNDMEITAWNALAVSAFAKASQVLDDARYARIAEETMQRLLNDTPDLRLLTRGRLGGVRIESVFLDDYAFLAQALVDLYDANFDVRYLDTAAQVMKILIERFQSAPGQSFAFTPLDQPGGILSQSTLDEDMLPSGNAVALNTLRRLALYGDNAGHEEQARAITGGLAGDLAKSGDRAASLLRGFALRPKEAREIVIVGELDMTATRDLLRVIHGRLLPGTVLAHIRPGSARDDTGWLLLAPRPLLEDRPTVYVCRNRICSFPVNSPSELATQLDANAPRPE